VRESILGYQFQNSNGGERGKFSDIADLVEIGEATFGPIRSGKGNPYYITVAATGVKERVGEKQTFHDLELVAGFADFAKADKFEDGPAKGTAKRGAKPNAITLSPIVAEKDGKFEYAKDQGLKFFRSVGGQPFTVEDAIAARIAIFKNEIAGSSFERGDKLISFKALDPVEATPEHKTRTVLFSHSPLQQQNTAGLPALRPASAPRSASRV
jgi:hypothetical protein